MALDLEDYGGVKALTTKHIALLDRCLNPCLRRQLYLHSSSIFCFDLNVLSGRGEHLIESKTSYAKESEF